VCLAIIKQYATSTWHKTNPEKYRICFIMFIDVWNSFVRLHFSVNRWLTIGDASHHIVKNFGGKSLAKRLLQRIGEKTLANV